MATTGLTMPGCAGPRFRRTGAADVSGTEPFRAGTTRHQDHKGMTGNYGQ
jgi:hypothetical protein